MTRMTYETPQSHLFLFGGGPKPAAALEKFFSLLAARPQHSLLFVAWASEEGDATVQAFTEEIRAYAGKATLAVHPRAPQTPDEARAFLTQLREVGGVFFSGGNQKLIMRCLAQFPTLHDALHEAYGRGVVFGGTSAGTAIMSSRMIAADIDPTVFCATQVEIADGLGLLDDCLVDQHFFKRQRQNRLMSLVLEHPSVLGLGIDEGAALHVEGNRIAEVVGPHFVMVVDGLATTGALKVKVLKENERYDLRERRRLPRITATSAPTPESAVDPRL